MSSLPPPPNLDALDRAGSLALFLDFDGTLVDIAPTPDGIAVPADLAQALCQLRDRLEGRLALVSGRALDDLERHLGHLPIARAGSHGSDCRAADGTVLGDAPAGLPESLLATIHDFAAREGFDTEDKPHGAALHYRANPSLEDRGLAFAKQVAREHGLQVKRGKCVIELVSSGADKAEAVRNIMQAAPFHGAMPVFVGDDVTDEDGMRAAAELGGFGIAVGERPSDNARYSLESPAAVQHWLGL